MASASRVSSTVSYAVPSCLTRSLDPDRVLELIAILILVTGMIGFAAALAGIFSAPEIWVSGLLITSCCAWRLRPRLPSKSIARWQDILLLAVLAISLRVPAYDYVLGGQDEGLYVNIANVIERTGGIAITDKIAGQLRGSPYLATYLEGNRGAYVIEGKTYPDYLNGIYPDQPEPTALEFQFYGLFPVWIALFGGLFGINHGVYALTFLSVLSVIFFYRLAQTLTDKRAAGLAAGLLLALNPLHAFFSKFPVTEVPALAFSTIAFGYLAIYTKTREGPRWEWLLISAAAMGCVFITRISGFMYIPFLVVLAMAYLIADSNRTRAAAVNRWAIGVAGLYGLSVVYGLVYAGHYAMDIYTLSFERLFGDAWKAGAGLLVCGTVAAWGGVAWIARHGKLARFDAWSVMLMRRAVGFCLLGALVVAAVKAYELGWTARFDATLLARIYPHLAHQGWRSVMATSFSQLLVYTGPALLLFLILAWRSRSEPQSECLRIFVIGFFVYIVTLQWLLPYGPYYARYLLSELVPYLLLFVVVIWSFAQRRLWRTILAAGLVLTGIYNGMVAAQQIGKGENAGLYGNLAKMLTGIGSNDLVLLQAGNSGIPNNSEIKTPLIYTFGLNVVTVNASALANTRYIAALDHAYDRVFLITPNSDAPSAYEFVRSQEFVVWAFRPTHFWPRQLVRREVMHLDVFRLRAGERN